MKELGIMVCAGIAGGFTLGVLLCSTAREWGNPIFAEPNQVERTAIALSNLVKSGEPKASNSLVFTNAAGETYTNRFYYEPAIDSVYRMRSDGTNYAEGFALTETSNSVTLRILRTNGFELFLQIKGLPVRKLNL